MDSLTEDLVSYTAKFSRTRRCRDMWWIANREHWRIFWKRVSIHLPSAPVLPAYPPNIRTLDCQGAFDLRLNSKTTPWLINVRSLTMRRVSLDDISLRLPNLALLTLNCCKLGKVRVDFPSLTKLTCTLNEGTEVLVPYIQSMTTLRELTVSDIRLTAHVDLTQHMHLTRLYYSGPFRSNDRVKRLILGGYSSLSHLTNLTSLEVHELILQSQGYPPAPNLRHVTILGSDDQCCVPTGCTLQSYVARAVSVHETYDCFANLEFLSVCSLHVTIPTLTKLSVREYTPIIPQLHALTRLIVGKNSVHPDLSELTNLRALELGNGACKYPTSLRSLTVKARIILANLDELSLEELHSEPIFSCSMTSLTKLSIYDRQMYPIDLSSLTQLRSLEYDLPYCIEYPISLQHLQAQCSNTEALNKIKRLTNLQSLTLFIVGMTDSTDWKAILPDLDTLDVEFIDEV